jgi:hypothetical protein
MKPFTHKACTIPFPGQDLDANGRANLHGRIMKAKITNISINY